MSFVFCCDMRMMRNCQGITVTKQTDYYWISTFIFRGEKPAEKTCVMLRKKYRNAVKFEKNLLASYEFAVSAADKKEINKLKFRYLNSKKVWLANTLAANAGLKIGQRHGALRCLNVAKQMGIKSLPPKEKVTCYPKNKPSGGVRMIFRFGLRYRTCQLVIRKMLNPHIKEKPWQYDFKPQSDAILKIRKDMENGFVHWQKRDIKNFFGSVHGKSIPKVLPLHKRLVEETCVSRSLNAEKDVLSSGKLKTFSKGPLSKHRELARRGIPQGAISSSSIAAYISSLLDIEVPKGIRLFGYVDDYLVLGKSRKKTKLFAQNLKAAIASLPGGDFLLIRKSSLISTENLVFLGYEFALQDGKVDLLVPGVSVIDMQKKIEDFGQTVQINLETTAKNKLEKSEVEYEFGLVWKQLEGWSTYFKFASNLEEQSSMLITAVSEYAEAFNLTLKDVQAFSKKHFGGSQMKYHPTTGS